MSPRTADLVIAAAGFTMLGLATSQLKLGTFLRAVSFRPPDPIPLVSRPADPVMPSEPLPTHSDPGIIEVPTGIRTIKEVRKGSSFVMDCPFKLAREKGPMAYSPKFLAETMKESGCVSKYTYVGTTDAQSFTVDKFGAEEKSYTCGGEDADIEYNMIGEIPSLSVGDPLLVMGMELGIKKHFYRARQTLVKRKIPFLTAEYISLLVKGEFDSATAFEMPDDNRFFVLEVAAKRDVSGDGYAGDQPKKAGHFIFWIDSKERQFLALTDSFAIDKCGHGYSSQLKAIVDANHDGLLDLLIGDTPLLLMENMGDEFRAVATNLDDCMC